MDFLDILQHNFKQLESAERRGIRNPVCVMLQPETAFEKAAEAFNYNLPRRWRSPVGWTRRGPTLIWTLRDTRNWLTADFGIVGRAVADYLCDAPRGPDRWQLLFSRSSLLIGGLRDGFPSWETGVLLRSPFKGYGMNNLTPVKNVPGRPRTVLLTLADGSVVPVYGPDATTFPSPYSTAALACTCSTRRLPSYTSFHRPVLPVSDALLVRILKTYYQPCHVVEAVRALRRAGGGQDAWLLQVINNSPELADLAAVLRKAMPEDCHVALTSS